MLSERDYGRWPGYSPAAAGDAEAADATGSAIWTTIAQAHTHTCCALVGKGM